MSLFEQIFGGSSTIITASAVVNSATDTNVINLTTLGLTNMTALRKRLVLLSWSMHATSTAAAATATLKWSMDSTGTDLVTIDSWDTPAAANVIVQTDRTCVAGLAPQRRGILDMGTSTGGSGTTIVDSTKDFTAITVPPVAGDLVVAGPADKVYSAFGIVTVVAATTLTVGGGWVGTAPPTSGAFYYVVPQFRKLEMTTTGGTPATWRLSVEAALVSDDANLR
jgi:hypothetical protein